MRRPRTARFVCTLAVLAIALSLAGVRAGSGCTPGDDGCLPTPQQCATGDYNGFWDGGAPGRFAVCAGADGHIVAYAGGSLYQPCGVVVANDQVVSGDISSDPNECRACAPADAIPPAPMLPLSASVPGGAPASAPALGASPSDFRAARDVGRISIDDIGEWPGSTEGTAVEPMIAVDPNTPNHVLAVYHIRAILAGGYAASRDGGKTWTSGGLPGFSAPTGGGFDATWDLAAAFGPDGSAYVTAGAGDRFPSNHAAIQIARSPDGGLTWLQPVTIVDEDTCVRLDKPWIAVDTFPTSSHFGRVYVVWTEFRTIQPVVTGGLVYSHIVMSHSDDRGLSWSAPVSVSDPADVIDFGAIPLIHPNGDVSVIGGVQTVDPGASSFDTVMLSHNSHDGGETFDVPVPIDVFLGISPDGLREAGYHTAAIDRTTGELFVAWPDARARLRDGNDIVVSRSSDGGATWSRAGVVTPGEAGRTYFLPALASDGGYVHLSYLTRGEGSDLVDTRYVVSQDGGATFGGELVLATGSDLKYSPRQGFCPSEPLPTLLFPVLDCGFLGDYTGIAAAIGHVYITWPHASKPPGAETTPNQTIWGAAIDR